MHSSPVVGLLAGLGADEAELGVRDRRADRARAVRVGRRGVGDRAGLGHAVALHDRAADALGRRRGQLGAQRRGAGVDELQARQVAPLDGRALGQRQDDRRHEVGLGDPVLLDQAEELLEVEARHQHDGRAPAQHAVHHDAHAVDVEQRQHARERVAGLDGLHRGGLQHVGDEVAVAEHHALGQARGAAGVRQRDDVAGLGVHVGRGAPGRPRAGRRRRCRAARSPRRRGRRPPSRRNARAGGRSPPACRPG